MYKIFSVGLFMLFMCHSHAQTVTDTVEILTPVEVRSIRVNARTPFAVTNISEKHIASENLGQNLPYFFNQAPSVVVSSDDGLGVGYTGMRIRGTDLTRTNYTLNGIPVNDPESQLVVYVNFADLASSVNSIQMQRGAGSSTNGPGAFGASVNISNLEQSKVPFAQISNSYGSYNTWKHTVRAGSGLLKGGFQFDARISKINSDGYIQRAVSDLKSLQFIAGWTSTDENTSLKFNLLTGKEKTGQAWNGIGVLLDETNNTNNFNYADTLTKIGRRTNTLGLMENGKYYDDQTDNYQQDYYQLFLNHKFNSVWSANAGLFYTRGRGYYNEYKIDESYADYGLQPFVKSPGEVLDETSLIRQLWLDNHYYGAVFSTNYRTAKTDVNIGGAYSQYDGDHYGFVKWAMHNIPADYKWYDLTADKNDFNIYAKWQQVIAENLHSFIDLQYRNVQYDLYGFRKSPHIESLNNYHFFNPKAGLSYYLFHNNATSKIYGSFAVANKEPNRDDFEANETEKPLHETLYDYELGYQLSTPKINAGANFYYMDYKNQLVLTGEINDVGAYARTNVDKSFRSGVELTFSALPASWLQFNANATFSRNKIQSIALYYDDYDNGGQIQETVENTDIAFSPNTIAGASITVEPFFNISEKNKFFVDVLGKYVGRQYLDNSSNIMRSINPYNLFDARLRYELKPSWIKEMNIILMLNNIFNKKYENNGYSFSYMYGSRLVTENYYYPQAGFNFNIGVTLNF